MTLLPRSLTHLTNQELLRLLIYNREMSPVIEELCLRLEADLGLMVGMLRDDTLHRVTCIACNAPLVVDYTANTNLFSVTFDKEKR